MYKQITSAVAQMEINNSDRVLLIYHLLNHVFNSILLLQSIYFFSFFS